MKAIHEISISKDIVTGLNRRVELHEVTCLWYSITFDFVVRYLDDTGKVLNNRRFNSFPVRIELNVRDHKGLFNSFCEAVNGGNLKKVFEGAVGVLDKTGYFD